MQHGPRSTERLVEGAQSEKALLLTVYRLGPFAFVFCKDLVKQCQVKQSSPSCDLQSHAGLFNCSSRHAAGVRTLKATNA